MTPPRILIAGIGNIFLGDDAFGSEVARRLADHPYPEGVRVVDFGIRGFDLTYALVDGYDVAILVDATQRGGLPGTLYVIEPDPEGTVGPVPPNRLIEPHGMDPVKVLRLAATLGGQPRRTLVVGCEPETFGTDLDPAMGLSASVEAAVGEAIGLIDSLVTKLIAEMNDARTRPVIPASS
jgi:hydrogenase maturation protease